MEQSPKQQVVERIKSSANILVTVSNNPSVDQLAACIGFTLMLNKLGKHATAVFSGVVPSTLEFLQPDKTLEKNTDSLQDFIIALDKSKADKLRYKVEDDVVRIFITPYRTSISEKDLEFSLGDFNVDAVVALGVLKKEEIDQAIIAHGRILHDATVMSVTSGAATSDVGAVNWNEPASSSLCEMLVSISESFQSNLLDPQMATSFLTGIVSETERFSNDKTSPKVMTMSAQLMAAGANQQLIATKLTPPEPEPAPAPEVPETVAEPYKPEESKESKESKESEPAKEAPHKPDGEIDITHDHQAEEGSEDEIHIDDEGNLKLQAELREAEKAKAEKARLEAEKAAADASQKNEEPLAGGSLLNQAHKVLDPLPGQGNFDPLLPVGEPSADQPEAAEAASTSAWPTSFPQPATTPDPAAAQAPEETPALTLPPLPAADPVPPAFDPLPSAANPLPPTAEAAAPAPQEVPPAPIIHEDETLAELEKEVDSPHVAMNNSASVDGARQAVATANLDSTPRPTPLQSVGAQPLDLNPPAPAPLPTLTPALPVDSPMAGVTDILSSTSSTGIPPAATPVPAPAPAAPAPNPLAPPPVPPPMTMPFFEPKTSHHNPYLNPDGKPAPDASQDKPA